MISFRHNESESARHLIEVLGAHEFDRFSNLPAEVTHVVNYGKFTSDNNNLDRWNTRHIPILNKTWAGDKLQCLRKMETAGIRVPETRSVVTPSRDDSCRDWLVKPKHGRRGQGITVWDGNPIPDGFYLQRKIGQIYELRVQAFAWIPFSEWKVLKRTNNTGAIAWNSNEGERNVYVREITGVFKRAQEISKHVLETLGYDFGAIDFLVDSERNLYFTEINTEPCCVDTNATGQVYERAFRALTEGTRILPAAIPCPEPTTTAPQQGGRISDRLNNVLQKVRGIQRVSMSEVPALMAQIETELQTVISSL